MTHTVEMTDVELLMVIHGLKHLKSIDDVDGVIKHRLINRLENIRNYERASILCHHNKQLKP
jgi:hypothetical protein